MQVETVTASSTVEMDVVAFIDQWNQKFIDNAKAQLKDLNQYSTEALEWLMMEHYQFSFRNVRFLMDAAELSGAFDTEAVKKVLIRNYKEENGHAVIDNDALKKIGVDIDTRVEFPATTTFLNTIGELVVGLEPSAVLGAMFATETAAIFEHEVFRDVSVEVIKRRNAGQTGDRLVWFHDMHLGGVEQSHRDELGIFLQGLPLNQLVEKEGDRPTVDTHQAIKGAEHAIEAMIVWWDQLFAAIKAASSNQNLATA